MKRLIKKRVKTRVLARILRIYHIQMIGIMLISMVLMTFGCRHTSEQNVDTNDKKIIKYWKQSNPTEEVIEIVSVDDLLNNPEDHINKNLIISGVVDDLQLKKSAKGYRILALDLRDTNHQVIPVKNETELIVKLNLVEQLDAVGEMLVKSTQDMDLSSIEPAAFEEMSYDLRINGNRIRALSNFFKSREMFEIGNDVELISNGYLRLGDAVYSFANISLETNPELMIEQIGIHQDIMVTEAHPNGFQDAVKMACQELSVMATLLEENRYKIANGELVLACNRSPHSSGYSLLSVGDLFEAKRWESKKNKESLRENQFDLLGKGFTQAGHGINDMYSGLQDLGEDLTIKVEPELPRISTFPTLKCAYVGYNRYVLKDCESKVKQLGSNGSVTVKGQLIRGNLHEQMNLLWLKMESVTVDDLTINLAHNESSSTWRNLSNFYDWVKETTN